MQPPLNFSDQRHFICNSAFFICSTTERYTITFPKHAKVDSAGKISVMKEMLFAVVTKNETKCTSRRNAFYTTAHHICRKILSCYCYITVSPFFTTDLADSA